MNEKGMSTVLLVIISATVLLLFAMSLVTLGRVQLENFLGSTRELGVRGTCLRRRDAFCDDNPNQEWVAAAYSYRGQNCDQFFSSGVYNCQQEEWSTPSEQECKEWERELIQEKEEHIIENRKTYCDELTKYNEECEGKTGKMTSEVCKISDY